MWNLSGTTKKLLFGFLVVALLAPGAYVAIQRIDAEPASALPTEELLSFPSIAHWVVEAVAMSVEHIGYKMLKNTLAKLGHNLAVQTIQGVSQGGWGQEPLFEIKPLGDQLLDEVKAGGGLFLEGLAVGAEQADADVRYANRPKTEVLKKDAEKKKDAEQIKLDKAIEDRQKAEAELKRLEELEKNRLMLADEAVKEQQKVSKKRDEMQVRLDACTGGRWLDFTVDRSPEGCGDVGALKSELDTANSEIKDLDTEIEKDKGALINNVMLIAAQRDLQQFKSIEAEKQGEVNTLGATIKEKEEILKFVDTSGDLKTRYKELRKSQGTAQSGVGDVAKNLIQSVCNPDFSVRLRLIFGVAQVGVPQKPLCTITQLTKNWDAAIKKTGIEDMFKPGGCCWKQLRDMVVPTGQEPMIALQIQSSYFEEAINAQTQALLQRQEDQPFKSVKSVAGAILTPGASIAKQFDSAIETSVKQGTMPPITGKLMADVVDLIATFTDSFMGKTWDLVMKGIVKEATKTNIQQASSGGSSSSGGPLYEVEGSPLYSQQKASQVRTAELAKLEYSPQLTDIKILSELQVDQNCLDNPNFCVLSEGLAKAVIARKTVQEAMDDGDIPKTGTFGFLNANGNAQTLCSDMNSCQEFKTNYPYHIMPILRKYRVIPVGWEIAALYIKTVPDACKSGDFEYDCTLENVVAGYTVKTSPFYRLVDPNWVLKLPAAKCAVSGYGPAVNFSNNVAEENKICRDTNGDGKELCTLKNADQNMLDRIRSTCGFLPATVITEQLMMATGTIGNATHGACGAEFLDSNDLIVTRPQNTCLDEQTCLRENPDGSCQDFGYCLEERKKVVFKGKTCDQEVVSCQHFTNAETNQSITILKRTIPGMNETVTQQIAHDACSKDYAGCAWYSKKRNNGIAVKTAEWSSSSQDRAYLTSSIAACNEEFAGCTALKNASDTTDAAFRVPPPEFECDKTLNGVPGYKREECRDYALQCGVEYTGCALYAPMDGDPRVAGTGPAACRTGCAGLANFLEKSTDIERRFGAPEVSTTTAIFAPSSAPNCPASESEIGCEEFTDLDAQRQGSGESLFTFSKIKACVPRPAEPEPRNFFYSWYGSDQSGGSRLVKFEYAHVIPAGGTDSVPKCAEGATCACLSTEVGTNDPVKGTCREFISVTGTLSLRWTDLLVHPVDPSDCHSYRRTIGGNIYSLSRTLSRSCRSSSVGCHEYRAPNAGNVQVIFSDDFESKSNRMWYAIGTANSTTTPVLAKPSSDTETLYETSIRHADIATLYRDLGSASLLKSSKYLLDFMVKPDAASTVTSAALVMKDATSGNLLTIASGTSRDLGANSVALPAGQWTNARMYFDLSGLSSDQVTGAQIRISFAPVTGAGGVTLTADRFIFKRMEGVEYKRKGNWTVSGDSCENDGEYSQYASQYGTYQYECRQYKPDAGGLTANYQGFSRLCPVEMVGCSEFTVPGSKKVVFADQISFAGWVSSNGITSVTSTADTLEVAGTPGATTAAIPVRRPTKLKSNTAYTVTLRFKETTIPYVHEPTGEKGFKALNVQLLKTATDSTPLKLANVDAAINVENRQYSPWRSFTFTTTGADFGAPEIDGLIQVYAVGAKGAHSYALDDIVFAETGVSNSLFLVADPQKSCPKAETGCTAYGVPVLDSAGNVKTEVKKLPNSSATSTVEKWTEKVFRITPEQIALATSTTTGVCQEQHLKCSAYTYTDKFGDEQTQKQAFFRDPGDRICKVKKVGEGYTWAKSVCPGTDTPCKKAGDCGKDASGAAIACEEQDCGSPTSTPPYLYPLDPDPNKPYWVYGCEKKDDTCRKITDPECGQNLLSQRVCTDTDKDTVCKDANNKDKFTGACLKSDFAPVSGSESGTCQFGAYTYRNEYGRNNTGVACRHEYYYLSDVSTRGCEGKVDVEKGCLLFHDDEVGSATTNVYASKEYYKNYWGTSGNDRTPQSVSKADPFNTATSTDSNLVLKARYDRECKTALTCTDYFEGGNSVVCYKRRPCETGANASCMKKLLVDGDGVGQLKGTFDTPQKTASTTPSAIIDLSFMSLTGLSRPNFTALSPTSSATFAIGGGHNGTFNWSQGSVATTSIASNTALGASYTSYFGTEGTLSFVSSTPTAPGTFIMNSCRVYPRGDTPDRRQSYAQQKIKSDLVSWVNACYYSKENLQPAEYRGIYGYCLEPNPKYYNGTLADYRTLAQNSPGNPLTGGYRSYCLNWHPIDRIAQQPPIVGAPGTGPGAWASVIATKPLYYCVGTENYSTETDLIDCKNKLDRTEPPASDGSEDTADSDHLGSDPKCTEKIKSGVLLRDVPNINSVPSWGSTTFHVTIPSEGTSARIFYELVKSFLGKFIADLMLYRNVWQMQDWFDDKSGTNPSYLILHVDNTYQGTDGNSHKNDWDNAKDVALHSNEANIKYDDIESIEYDLTFATRKPGNPPTNGEYGNSCTDSACKDIVNGDGTFVSPRENEGDANKQIISPSTDPTFTYMQRDKESRKDIDKTPWLGDNTNWANWRRAIDRGNIFNGGGTVIRSNNDDLCWDGRNFLGVKPNWSGTGSNKTLNGWHWRMCDDDGSWNAEIAFVKIRVNLKYNRTFVKNKDTQGTYCSDFVTLVDKDGRNVAWQVKEKATPIAKHISAAGGEGGWIFDATTGCCSGTGCTPGTKVCRAVTGYQWRQYETVDARPPINSSSIKRHFTPGPASADYWSNMTAAADITVSSVDALSVNHFAKLFEYWKWNDTLKKYTLRAHVDANGAYQADNGGDSYKTSLESKWNDIKKNSSSVTPPVINPITVTAQFGQAGANADEQIVTSELRRVQLSFSVDVNNDQLPIRFLDIDWGDEPSISSQPMSQEGRGLNEGGPFTYSHVYDLDKLENEGSTICIRVIDNFEAGTKSCAKIRVDGSGNFTPDAWTVSPSSGKDKSPSTL